MALQEALDAARAAGFSGESLRIALAVAKAESGFSTTAVSPTGDYGIWQINLAAHPQYSPDQMFDPFLNARAAWEISGGGQNWQPWTTFTSGAYQQFLDTADQAIGLSSTSGDNVEAQIQTVMQFLTAQLGKPYQYGGSGPDVWDCSGLTLAAFATIGVTLPHDAAVQATMGEDVSGQPIQAADLLCRFGDGVENGHSGIAISPTEWINAPHTGDVVKVAPIPLDITAHRRFVSGKSFGDRNNVLSGITNPLSGVADIAKNIGKAAAWLANAHNILRVIEVILGGAAAVMGAMMVAGKLNPSLATNVKNIGKAGAKVAAL